MALIGPTTMASSGVEVRNIQPGVAGPVEGAGHSNGDRNHLSFAPVLKFVLSKKESFDSIVRIFSRRNT